MVLCIDNDTKELQDSSFHWLTGTQDACLDSYWIDHSLPKPIKIAGNDSKSVFTRGFDCTKEILDLAIRRFGQLDKSMYGEGLKLRWMHPFESDFAEKVLRDEVVLNSRSVRAKLTVNAEFYNLCDCRMIIVPNLMNSTWTSYFWDMKEEVVHIVDPTFDTAKTHRFHDLHSPIVDKIQLSLQSIFEATYDGCEIGFKQWRKNYVDTSYTGIKRHESGLMTLRAMRYFNGTNFESNHSTETLSSFSRELLYDIMCVEGNKGSVPGAFIHDIE